MLDEAWDEDTEAKAAAAVGAVGAKEEGGTETREVPTRAAERSRSRVDVQMCHQ
jgi:hypothetical protein